MWQLRAFLTFTALALPTAALPCTADAIVVFDSSASMGGLGREARGRTRMQEARMAMAEITPQVAQLRRIGLVTYGPGTGDENACEGIALRFPPIENATTPLLDTLAQLEPTGLTPLTAAVERAAEALDYRNRPAVLVVVTDGNESCGGEPCNLSTQLQADAVDLTVHIIGFKVVRDFFAWNDPVQRSFFGGEIRARCLSEDSGGEYVSADTVDALIEALQVTLGCPLYGALPRGHG